MTANFPPTTADLHAAPAEAATTTTPALDGDTRAGGSRGRAIAQINDRVAFAFLVSALLLLYGLLQNAYWVPAGDSELYTAAARNMARGEGYTFNGQPIAIIPPGWAWLMSMVMRVTPYFLPLKLMAMTFMIGALLCSYWIVRRFVTPIKALCIILLTAVLSHVYQATYWLISESSFCLATTASILIAMQIADRLRKLGHFVGLLALIDTMPPSSTGHWRHNRREIERTEWQTFMNVMEIPGNRKMYSRWSRFWRSSEAEKIQYVLELAKAHDAMPKGMSEAEFARLVSVFQANLRALQEHIVPSFDGRMLLFQPDSEMPKNRRESIEIAEFWRSKAKAGCEVLSIKGDHSSMVTSPRVDVIAERLRREIEMAPRHASAESKSE